VFAQNSNSTIDGTVRDTSGAVVSGATVGLTNIGTSQQLSTTSGQDGFYTFTNLSPSDYKVTVSAPGFANWIGVLTLRVSQTALVDPKLNAASVTTQVTVKDVTPIIDKVDPTISDVKNATTIETLPVQNRSILNVLAFSPGVVAGNYGGAGANWTRVNGVPGGSMDYLVDGQTMVNKNTNELQTNPQPLPTFQEVKIITGNGDAQYGRPGIVELVTKSGTNQFHGQAFELNQNTLLQARTFNSGPSIPYLQHNEYGGQLGGPVWLPKIYNGKDKTFFFFDYEGIRQNGNVAVNYRVPTQAMRTGDLSSLLDINGNPLTIYDPNSTSTTGPPFTRTQFDYNGTPNVIPPNRLNAVSQKILGQVTVAGFIPLPLPNINNPDFWNGTPNYIPTSAANTIRNQLYTAKVDKLFGPNRLAMRYTYTNRSTVSPGSYYILDPNVTVSGGHNGAIVFTEVISPKAVNVVRAGVQYNHSFIGPMPISPPVTGVLGLPTYVDTIGWPSFYWDGNFDYYWSGIDRNNPQDSPDSTITASDQFSYNRGNHQLMFGFKVDNNRLTTITIGQPGGGYNYSGNFTGLQDPASVAAGTNDVAQPGTGSGFADFLLGETDSVNLNIYPNYHTRQTEYAGFVQDNWRATQNLTLNLGLRYEYWTAFADASGLQSTFNPNIPGGMVVYQGNGALPAQTPPEVFASFQAAGMPIESAAQANYPLSLWNMPKNNWEPRLGFAYQLNSKTVLRGGWGIYQWVMPLIQYQASARKNPPFSYSVALNPGMINGVSLDAAASELEFPNATSQYGGPQPLNQYMLGNNSTLVLNTSNAAIQQGGGFGMVPFDTNYKPQTVQEYNLTLAQELPYHTGFQLSYIGNHTTNLPEGDPINMTIPREDCTPAEGGLACTPAQRRLYPVFATSNNYGGAMSEYRYIGYANTNELQAQLTHTFGNGLSLQSYFTWQRTLTTQEIGYFGWIGTNAQMIPAALTPGYTLSNPNSGASTAARLRAVYSNDPELPDKTFSFNANYEFPFGRGKKFLGNSHGFVNELVSGYNIAPFFLWHSGLYFAPYYTQFNSGTNLAPGKTGILPEGQRTAQHWFDYSIDRADLGQPYTGQTYIQAANPLDDDFRNNVPDNYMTGPGFNNMDATIYKLTPLGRGNVLDIEAQVFNVYNHQNLALPNSQGIITQSIGLPRTIQLQAKYIF
jgi:hypothetical protein